MARALLAADRVLLKATVFLSIALVAMTAH
jgi:hypothetical protein